MQGVRHCGALSWHAEAQDSATGFSDVKGLALRACALVQRSVDGGSAGMVAAPDVENLAAKNCQNPGAC